MGNELVGREGGCSSLYIGWMRGTPVFDNSLSPAGQARLWLALGRQARLVAGGRLIYNIKIAGGTYSQQQLVRRVICICESYTCV